MTGFLYLVCSRYPAPWVTTVSPLAAKPKPERPPEGPTVTPLTGPFPGLGVTGPHTPSKQSLKRLTGHAAV